MIPVCFMGLTEAELTALASEGVSLTETNTMTDGMKDMLRSVMMAVGAVMLYMGYWDQSMVNEFVGGALGVFSAIWSWMAHE